MVVTRAEICSFSFLVVQVQRFLSVLGKKTPLESICEKITGEVVCAPTIVSWRLSWLFVLRPSCRGDCRGSLCSDHRVVDMPAKYFCEMLAGTPRGP